MGAISLPSPAVIPVHLSELWRFEIRGDRPFAYIIGMRIPTISGVVKNSSTLSVYGVVDGGKGRRKPPPTDFKSNGPVPVDLGLVGAEISQKNDKVRT